MQICTHCFVTDIQTKVGLLRLMKFNCVTDNTTLLTYHTSGHL